MSEGSRRGDPAGGASELRTVPVHAQSTGPAGRRPDLDPAPLSSEGFSTEEGSVPHGKDGSPERDTGRRRPSPLSWVPGTEVQPQGARAGAAPEARAAEGASPREGEGRGPGKGNCRQLCPHRTHRGPRTGADLLSRGPVSLTGPVHSQHPNVLSKDSAEVPDEHLNFEILSSTLEMIAVGHYAK